MNSTNNWTLFQYFLGMTSKEKRSYKVIFIYLTNKYPSFHFFLDKKTKQKNQVMPKEITA